MKITIDFDYKRLLGKPVWENDYDDLLDEELSNVVHIAVEPTYYANKARSLFGIEDSEVHSKLLELCLKVIEVLDDAEDASDYDEYLNDKLDPVEYELRTLIRNYVVAQVAKQEAEEVSHG